MKRIIILLLTLITVNIFSTNNVFNFNNTNFYSDEVENDELDMETFYKNDNGLKIAHATLAAVSFAYLIALQGIYYPLTYLAYEDSGNEAITPLKYAGLGISYATIISFATTVTLAFIKLGLKAKAGIPIRKSHIIAAGVALAMYVFELVVIIVNSVFTFGEFEGKETLYPIHGAASSSVMGALSISLITLAF